MTVPDVRAAHDAQQAAIPPADLIEHDTTLGGTIPTGGSAQHYRPNRRPDILELTDLLEQTDPDDPARFVGDFGYDGT